jgi:hypothetical protein
MLFYNLDVFFRGVCAEALRAEFLWRAACVAGHRWGVVLPSLR